MSNLKKRAIFYIKHKLSNNEILDLISKFVIVNLAQSLFRMKYQWKKVNTDKVIFECFQGRSASDSPLAIYNELYKSRKDLSFVWVLNSVHHELYEELNGKRNTKVVVYGSKDYDYEYATAGYWVVNCRLPFRLVKKKKQKYIQCWHGTPLKNWAWISM